MKDNERIERLTQIEAKVEQHKRHIDSFSSKRLTAYAVLQASELMTLLIREIIELRTDLKQKEEQK